MRTFTQTLKFFFLACALVLASNAWGNTVTFNATNSSFSGDAPYKITQDHVDFYLRFPNWYNNGNGHFYIWTSNSDASITWTPKPGYTIAVTGVSLNGQNANETHYYSLWWHDCIGSSYIRSHTSSDNTEVKISQSTTTQTISYTTANNTNVFPGGNALGNNAYFKLRAEKGYKDADQNNSYEYQINTATLTYTVSANKYTVTLNNQSATTAGTGSIKVTFDSNANLAGTPAITVPTRTDYIFDGYWTEVNGGGVQVIAANGNVLANVAGYTDASKNWKYAGNVTLYAKWIFTRKTITLDDQSATTAGTSSITVYYNQNTNLAGIPAITIPTKTGCTFEGYYTSTAGSGLQIIAANGNVNANVAGYTDGDKNWIYDGNVTLYAYWKQNQTITWDLVAGAEYATGTLMDATASSGLPVTYTPNAPGDGVAGYINENGRLVVVEPNKEITITASQAGNDNWNAAPDVSKTIITLGANPNQYTDVHASGITYGDLLSASTLSGKVYLDGVEIAGTLSWVDPAIMPDAGTAPHMVLFTPTNTAAYSSVYFEVPVTVAKATPVITWNISNILREHVRYGHFVESSNKEAELSYNTSNATLLNITDGVLTTGEVSSKEEGWIKVSQPETDNYEAYNETWTLKYDVGVYPKAGICLPIDLTPTNVNAESDFNNANVAQVGSVNWCNTNENGRRDNYIAWFDVRYTQHQGIALGSWEAGLEGLGPTSILSLIATGKFDYSSKSVDLFFSGIPNTISFDVKSQVVTSSPPNADWEATQKNWYIYVSVDGENFGSPVISWTGDRDNVSYTFTNDDIRFVRIEYRGNFTGFVKNLRITQKRLFTTDKSSLTFGTEAHPLQEPQALTLSYSSLGVCGGMEDAITVTSSNPAFYVDEETITENVGVELKGSYTIRVRCNDVNQSGTLTFSYPTTKEGTKTYTVSVNSTDPATRVITSTPTAIFQTGTEHAPMSGTSYRALRTHDFSACFNGSPVFDTLYIYGVSESSAANRQWVYDASKGYKVPVVTASNVHTPCFVYKKEGAQYTYVRTFDASTKTLNVTDSKTRVFVGYRPEAPATTAFQLETGAAVSLNNTEIVATNAAIAVSGNATIAARGANIVSSASKAAIQLAGTATLTINDSWKTAEPSAILALRPASGYPSIDLGSANGRVDVNGTQLELHNAANMAIAHMDGTTEKFDGEVHINDGSIGGAETLGMPKLTFIDGGTFNDGTVVAYTLKGQPKRPRNSRGEIVSRQTMTKTALEAYDWYGQAHLTLDGSAKVNPMLMDEEVWIFNGTNSDHSDDATSWNKGTVPGETADVLINAPMVVSGGELKVKSLTINWEDKGKGIPAVTVNPNGGLTVGEGGIDAIKLAEPEKNLVLKAGTEGATKGQTGFLRIHPESAEPMPQATVELFNTGYYDTDESGDNSTTYQCVGAPIADAGVKAKTVYPSGNWVYKWNESTEDWTNSRTKMEFEPFKGFEITQYRSTDGWLVSYTGHLVPGDDVLPIDLVCSSDKLGYNLLANSFMAPIDISQFQSGDFVNAKQTIYMLNAGTKEESDGQKGDFDAPGRWLGIPIKTAEKLAEDGYPRMIPAMQGFWIKAEDPEKAEHQLRLDYSRLVWGIDYSGFKTNQPLRAPKYSDDEQSITGRLKININSEKERDFCYILESEGYDAAYEDGYDAHKIASETMDVFTIRDNDQLGVDATNSIVGTRVGVRTSEETEYTFRFSHIQTENDLALWDKEARMKVYINEDVEYTFYAVPNSTITERFEIVAVNVPTVTTGVDEIQNETHIQKFIKDNQLYILKDGVLYNASGAVVRK